MYYTYLWLREDGTPYYVGKGKGNRAFINHRKRRVRVPKDSERIIVQEHFNEEEAFESEKFLISFFGREDLGLGFLLNRTDGGEGQAGLKHTNLSKEKIRSFQKSHRKTEQHIRNAANGQKGSKKSQATKDKIRETLKRLGIKPPSRKGLKNEQ